MKGRFLDKLEIMQVMVIGPAMRSVGAGWNSLRIKGRSPDKSKLELALVIVIGPDRRVGWHRIMGRFLAY
jgi:hypothetical protein